MPKMYSKESALRIIFKAARKLERLLEEKGLTESDISKGELRRIFNVGGKRGKDILSMALRKFMIGDVISTPYWELRVIEPDKPRIHFKILRKNKRRKR